MHRPTPAPLALAGLVLFQLWSDATAFIDGNAPRRCRFGRIVAGTPGKPALPCERSLGVAFPRRSSFRPFSSPKFSSAVASTSVATPANLEDLATEMNGWIDELKPDYIKNCRVKVAPSPSGHRLGLIATEQMKASRRWPNSSDFEAKVAAASPAMSGIAVATGSRSLMAKSVGACATTP